MTREKMSHLQYIRQWNDGVNKLLDNDVTGALEDFKSISSPTAKIHFNMALAHKRLKNNDLALQELSGAIQLDPNFAVAYFVKGCYLFEEKRYQEALDAFVEGQKKLFGRQFINYHQLGLKFVLRDEYFEKNIAVCEQKLNLSSEPLVQLVTLPPRLVFQPPKNKVQGLEKIDFLGQATVITAQSKLDIFTGFTGTKLIESQPAEVIWEPSSLKPTNPYSPASGIRVLKQCVRPLGTRLPSQLPLQGTASRWTSEQESTDSEMGFLKERLVTLPWNESKDKNITDDESDICDNELDNLPLSISEKQYQWLRELDDTPRR